MPTDVASARDLIIDLAIRYGFQVLGALVIGGAGLALAHWLGGLTDRWLRRQPMEPPMRTLTVRVVRVVVLLFTVVVALDKFGFQIAPLVAGIGVAGLGLGIALQGVLSNVVAGLSIIFTKPFRVGEFIELLGVHGEVVAIELFSTSLVHPDRSRVVIPNRKIVGEILHNFGTMRQVTLTVRVPLDADLGAALAAARAVTVSDPRVLAEPAPVIGVTEVGPLGVRLSVQPWVAVPDVVPVQAELYRGLLERFRSERIGVTPVLPALPAIPAEEEVAMEFVSRILEGSVSLDLRDALRRSVSSGYRISQDEKIRRLEEVPMFADCTRKQLRQVAAISKVVELPAGTILTRTGEPGDAFFVIVDGSATVEVSPRKRSRLSPGDFFGEMSLLDGEPRSATVRAETDVRLLVIQRLNFQVVLREVPDLLHKILVTLTRRVRHLERSLAN